MAELRVSKNAVFKVFSSHFSKAIAVFMSVLIVGYIVVAATLVRVVFSWSDGTFYVVKNNTFAGGTIPPGKYILVDTEVDEVGTDSLSKLRQAFIPKSSYMVLKVSFGPTGKIQWSEPNKVSVDDKLAPLPLSAAKNGLSPLSGNANIDYLKGEYLGECISGVCKKGEMAFASEKQVVGILVGK